MLIATIKPADAAGNNAEIYAAIRGALGRVPNAMVLLSASPWQLERRWLSLSHYESHPHLGAALRTAIRLQVARRHHCRYCIGVNEMLMRRHGWSEAQIAAPEGDGSPLTERERVLLEFAIEALTQPQAVSAATIAALRDASWTDSDILDALCYAGEALVADRLIDAFKVEEEAF